MRWRPCARHCLWERPETPRSAARRPGLVPAHCSRGARIRSLSQSTLRTGNHLALTEWPVVAAACARSRGAHKRAPDDDANVEQHDTPGKPGKSQIGNHGSSYFSLLHCFIVAHCFIARGSRFHSAHYTCHGGYATTAMYTLSTPSLPARGQVAFYHTPCCDALCPRTKRSTLRQENGRPQTGQTLAGSVFLVKRVKRMDGSFRRAIVETHSVPWLIARHSATAAYIIP